MHGDGRLSVIATRSGGGSVMVASDNYGRHCVWFVVVVLFSTNNHQ